ncbi:glycosyltransferase [Limnobacter parvus]|uniref:Glycosyltransferase n=1 Tax=Limnobacter parvus TaxID=2939690 RepID=A0ABT1XD75_9BURK|nr:glycosyltransferase [Limnobacter parvus]MCR2745225.1 glycosyltransferase [Limnobacter parvus]
MKTVLVLSFFPAFVPPSNGGESRLLNFYCALSQHFKVVLLSSTGHDMAAEEVWHTPTFVEKRIPRDQAFLQAWQQLLPLSSGGDLSAPALLRAGIRWTRLHDAYWAEYATADVLVHESPFTQGIDLFMGCDNKPRIYCAYNCEAALYKMLHPAEKSQPLVDEIQQAEHDLLQSVDALFYCAENDVTNMRSFADFSDLQILYTPHGVSSAALNAAKPHVVIPEGKAAEVYFIGSAHPPNVTAANYIAHELAPTMPQIVFHLIGGCGGGIKSSGNLHVHGFVANHAKEKIIAGCALAINPLNTGGGASLKILDFIAAGKPVLSTKYGARGYGLLPGAHYLNAELHEFKPALEQALALGNKVLEEIADKALQHVRSTLTWNSIAGNAADLLATLIENAQNKPKFTLVLNDYNSFDAIGGGATRTQGLCEALARLGPVVLLAYSNSSYCRNYKVRDVRVLEVPRSKLVEEEIESSRGSSHISTADILTAIGLESDQRIQGIYAVLRQHASAVVVEHCYMAPLPLQFADRFVYSSQNNETELKRGLLAGHPEKAKLLEYVQKLEGRCISGSSLTVAVSDEDATAFSEAQQVTAPIVVIPNGVVGELGPKNLPEFDSNAQKAFERPVNVVFLGSAHMPNVLAAQFLVKEVVPRCPSLHFHFVGSVCSSVLGTHANVTLWGTVSSELKTQILYRSQIALNPVLDGSGSNVKFADYLAHGLPTLSTEFGLRGYPEQARIEATLATKKTFVATLLAMASKPALWNAAARDTRIQMFRDLLDFRPVADRFAQLVDRLNRPRKNVLFVTYRYTNPARGGAEIYARHLIDALDQTGRYNIDVVSTNACEVVDIGRFASRFDAQPSATFQGLQHTRVARFPVDVHTLANLVERARPVWFAHIEFEKTLWNHLSANVPRTATKTELLWGWAPAEVRPGHVVRWALKNAGMWIHNAGVLEIKGYAHKPSLVRVAVAGGETLCEQKIEGEFALSVVLGQPCELEINSTLAALQDDARPLALLIKQLIVGGSTVDLAAQRPIDITVLKRSYSEPQLIDLLAKVSQESRARLGVSLTNARGPHSQLLEHYLTQQVAKYDLVVTHNVVFKTAQVAINTAHQQGVPSILVPHVHLDDDYYHFPDLLQTAQQSSLVLASPMDAVRYYDQRQCNVDYLPAGIDEKEFTQAANHELFTKLYTSKLPFVLVLGRKSGAKNYDATIRAIERINEKGARLNMVMIGPDDDQKAIKSPHLFYLGPQPRSIVLSALHNCFALCNMSQSESFGIVLLEAWMAGKPVLANAQCGAFAELVNHGENGLLVTEATLQNALVELLESPSQCESMGAAGKSTASAFTWNSMQKKFLQFADQVLTNAVSSGG